MFRRIFTDHLTRADSLPPHADWKIFCTDCFSIFPAVRSNSSISAEESCHPRAPRFSLACARVLTPTIGTVPLQMHQFRATCDMVLSRAVAISVNVERRGPIVGRTRRNMIPRGPEGIFPVLYFPVRSPRPRGEYAIVITPRDLAVSRRPFSSGILEMREN